MKNYILPVLSFVTLLSLYACAPVYQCGEAKPDRPLSGSNRLIAVVEERDALCDELEIKSKETNYFLQQNQILHSKNDSLISLNNSINREKDSLITEFKTLKTEHNALQEKHLDLSTQYSSAITEKLNQGHLYDERIKEKERRMAIQQAELDSKMALLKEREKQIQSLESEIAKQDSLAKRLNQLLKEALLGFESDDLQTEIKDGKVYILMSENLMFASGKAEVQAKGKDALAKLASVLKKNKEFQILVEGHTDNVPISTSRYKDNWDLSVDRATEIVRILQEEYQVDPLRLTASGRGEFLPRENNNTASGRAKNRRTEIILSPNLGGIMELIKE
ncbi:MAG: OmpA family protein [Brumimicrobium sp.]